MKVAERRLAGREEELARKKEEEETRLERELRRGAMASMIFKILGDGDLLI